MSNELRIKMTSIPVNDPIAAFKFYTEVLGFKELQYMPDYKLAVIVGPNDLKGTALMLEPNDNPISAEFQSAVRKAGLPVLILGAADVQSKYEALKSKGIVFKSEPSTNEWGTSAVFDDTFGNYIMIHQDD